MDPKSSVTARKILGREQYQNECNSYACRLPSAVEIRVHNSVTRLCQEHASALSNQLASVVRS